MGVTQISMARASGPLYEYACHEGNYSLPSMLAGARAAMSAAASTDAAATGLISVIEQTMSG